MNIVAFMVMCVGQICHPSICIEYLYGDMSVESRFMTQVKYDDGRYWNVYVVNGYLPTVTITPLSNGDTRYVYDYRKHIAYKPTKNIEVKPEIKKPLDIKPLPLKVANPEPKKLDIKPLPLVPTPDPAFTNQKTDGTTLPSAIAEPERVVRPNYGRPN